MMNIQELETAVRLNLDLICVIINDGGLGMIRMKQMSDGYGNLGVDFGSQDFAKIAVGFGAHGHRISLRAEIPGILQEAKTKGGVHVVDVPVDYRENQGVMQEMMMVNCANVLEA